MSAVKIPPKYRTEISDWFLPQMKREDTPIAIVLPKSDAYEASGDMEFAVYKTRPNVSLGFELDDDSYAEMWSAFKALYGAWADRDDFGEDWLDQLRDSWDDSFNALYETEE